MISSQPLGCQNKGKAIAIFWCSNCRYLREVGNDYLSAKVKCPKCEQARKIYDTSVFASTVLKKYFASCLELQHIRDKSELSQQTETPDAIAEQQVLEALDLHNTDSLTSPQQYEPILQWLKNKKITCKFDPKVVDTTGFFDEVAVQIGEDYATLSGVIKSIKFGYSKGFNSTKITLSTENRKEAARIKKFCALLYDYTFVVKKLDNYKKDKNAILLFLQQSPNIVRFFNGEWMEWFIMMKLLTFFNEKHIRVSCLRGLKVMFTNNVANELDVFLLVDGRIPICIECKTGEFRPDIKKYLELKKRLKLDKSQFLLCVIGMEPEQISGLNHTYDLTFTNEQNLIEYVDGLLD